MTDSPNLALPFIEGGELLPDVTLNEALRLIDTLVQLAVVDRDLNAPPGSPAEGQRWIVKASPSPTGAWAGHGNHVAAWQDGGWVFSTPKAGWLAYVADEGAMVAWSGTAWVAALDVIGSITVLQNLSLLGVGTTADSTNPLSAKLNNALWTAKTVAEGGDGHLRYKMSKESAAKTLSLLLQTNFSGRAEVGLTGDDNLHVKVSADGSTWLDAITIDKSTAKLSLGTGFTDRAATRAQIAAAPFDALAFNGMQVNGNVDVSQELGTTGVTLVSNAAAVYGADSWLGGYKNSAAVVTFGQVAAASFPAALSGYSFGMQLKATTALTSLANGDLAYLRTRAEGYRVARLGWGASGAQSLSYAFNFYSTASGIAFVRVFNSAGDRFYYQEFTAAAGWNFVTGTIPGDTSGTWLKDNGRGLSFDVVVAGKDASPAAPGSWGTSSVFQTTNSTNLLATNNNLCIVTGLLLLPGIELPASDRAPLIMRPFDRELPLCQRQYWKTFNYATVPAQNIGNNTGEFLFAANVAGTGVNRPPTIPLPVKMRAVPSFTSYNPAGTNNLVRDQIAVADFTSTGVSSGEWSFRVAAAGNAATAIGNLCGVHVTADARL